MGWSYTQDAGDTLDTLFNQCYAQTKIQNKYIGKDGRARFIEVSRREYDDGHITGKIWAYDTHDSRYVYASGSLRINADGTLPRYPTSWPFPKNVESEAN